MGVVIHLLPAVAEVVVEATAVAVVAGFYQLHLIWVACFSTMHIGLLIAGPYLHLGESGALSEWIGGDQEAQGTAGAPSQRGRHLHLHPGGGSAAQLLMS
ncbi:hypothetical protein C5167_046307 [Papaver somniferum]|uniref:Uncharacterized protein n=1 Tax=Papaver somniferum TaxID=3469 RepID=A0A4Y7LH91_PAPSO|nr:hypothetical protein C5167_046307 [Papaver somniferum]